MDKPILSTFNGFFGTSEIVQNILPSSIATSYGSGLDRPLKDLDERSKFGRQCPRKGLRMLMLESTENDVGVGWSIY